MLMSSSIPIPRLDGARREEAHQLAGQSGMKPSRPQNIERRALMMGESAPDDSPTTTRPGRTYTTHRWSGGSRSVDC